MYFTRLPRFKRVPAIAPMQLEERDRQIIRLVHRHRFIRSDRIATLIDGSRQQVLRRLQLLYHHGYLERPRAQLQYFEKGGSRSIAYGLGKKAGVLLKELGFSVHPDSWNEKNHDIGRVYLEHSLFVADVMATIELACRKRGDVKMIYGEDLAHRTDRQPFRWYVKIQNGWKLGVIPDSVFALEFTNQNGSRDRAYFFVEADRGTMPVKRHSLSQTSFYRKMLAYEATWSQSIHRKRFGFRRFQVLTVTTSAKRLESMTEACSQLKRGRGLFLFTDRTVLETPERLLSTILHSGN